MVMLFFKILQSALSALINSKGKLLFSKILSAEFLLLKSVNDEWEIAQNVIIPTPPPRPPLSRDPGLSSDQVQSITGEKT